VHARTQKGFIDALHLQFDAEIIYLESKGREQLQQLETVSQELNKTYRQGNEQVSARLAD